DLDPLLDSDGQVRDERVRRDGEAVLLGDLRHLAADAPAVEEAGESGLLVAEGDVLRDGEDRDEHEVLVHHADARRDGVTWSLEGDWGAVDQDLAAVRLVQAV